MRFTTRASIVTVITIHEILNWERLHSRLLFNSNGWLNGWSCSKSPTRSTIHLFEWTCHLALCSPVSIRRHREEWVIVFINYFNIGKVFHEWHFADVHICKVINFHLWSWILEWVVILYQIIDSRKILESCRNFTFCWIALTIGGYELDKCWFNLEIFSVK